MPLNVARWDELVAPAAELRVALEKFQDKLHTVLTVLRDFIERLDHAYTGGSVNDCVVLADSLRKHTESLRNDARDTTSDLSVLTIRVISIHQDAKEAHEMLEQIGRTRADAQARITQIDAAIADARNLRDQLFERYDNTGTAPEVDGEYRRVLADISRIQSEKTVLQSILTPERLKLELQSVNVKSTFNKLVALDADISEACAALHKIEMGAGAAGANPPDYLSDIVNTVYRNTMRDEDVFRPPRIHV